ncbi:hypothetical protein Leryth_003783 [Lithospermum erythrorhizon]|nr:hypothetical protein Leryth_003783 [Lithospermum erythrorhizon]
MSTVDKMLIKGIRSFDPENKNVITFFKPLTLIVGPNGAGKTTIIECLKVACTGELPPNARSGQSFIHDPKVAGETETKGQIKLRFKTAAGKDVVCIRSFQLTQKATKLEYKAIESVLQTINPHTGEKVCLSYRCADMDREIPALMGVSKAILENVIFVHQDEANWPLQESSTLKKKFDDIFSATRYTKALEVIKKLHKDQAQEIKSYKLKLEHLQTLKDAAYKLMENIGQDQEKTETLKVQIQELEKEIQNIELKIHQKEVTLKDIRRLLEQIGLKSAERSTLFREQQKQYAALAEENEDTDEELIEWQAKFEEKLQIVKTKLGKLEREKNDMESKSSVLKETIKKSIWHISKLKHEAEAHLSLKNERDMILQQLFEKYNVGSLPGRPFSDEVAINLTNRINTRLNNVEKDLKEKKELSELELKGAMEQILEARNRLKEIKYKMTTQELDKEKMLKRIEEKEKERDELDQKLSRFNLAHLDERENHMRIEFERKTSQLIEGDFDNKKFPKNNEIQIVDHKIKMLEREKDAISEYSDDRAKLSLQRADLENHKKKFKKIVDDNNDKIRGVLKGRLPSDKDLKKEITRVQRAVQVEFDDLNSKAREAEKEVNMMELKIQEVKNNLSKFHKDIDSRLRFLEQKMESLDQQSAGADCFPKVFDSAKEKRDVLKSKYSMADGMRQMFDPFERVARAHHMCPCCERPFSAQEESEFVKKQRVKALSSAEQMKLLALESSTADSVLQQLDKLRVVYEEYVKLTKESVPLAERTLAELDEELEKKNQALDDVLGVLAQVKADKDSVDALIQPVENADRELQDIQKLQAVVDDLEYKVDFRGHSVKSLEDINTELNSLRSSRDNLRKDLDRLTEEHLQLKEDQLSLKSRWHEAREEKTEAAHLFENHRNAENELDSLAEEKCQVELELKHLADALVPLSKETEKLEKHHKKLKEKLDSEIDEQTKFVRDFEQQVGILLDKTQKIEEYNESTKAGELQGMQEEHASQESGLRSCEKKMEEIEIQIQKSKDVMRSQDELKRNIEANLNYRKTKSDVDKLTTEIESLEGEVLKLGGLSRHETESIKLSQERERLLSELNRYKGTMSVYHSNISNNKMDLKQSQYKDIDRRYFDQLIQLKTTEMANKDLDKYYNALDKALMRFHAMKMEEINKIIRELWQQTYRGQDIDYICIHSDSAGAGTRSYSYKVLMQTGNAELEMRGRCSAGQKVLASLIIRLALAETFCLNCGILALDEPTTNLDGPNSASLAAALLRIMEDRRGQENFQMIVITHDERFAQLIGQRQLAEKYYRISKDDHQHSIIEAQEIFD